MRAFANTSKVKTFVSEVGFEPTPTFVDQNAPLSQRKRLSLESGALDRSAILTCQPSEERHSNKNSVASNMEELSDLYGLDNFFYEITF